MSADADDPWPATWPPFWRGIVHVAIATGVGNFILATGVAASLEVLHCWSRPRSNSFLCILPALLVLSIFVHVAVCLVVVIPAVLEGVAQRTRLRLICGFSLGTLAMEACLAVSMPASFVAGMGCAGAKTVSAGLTWMFVIISACIVLSAFIGFSVAVGYFGRRDKVLKPGSAQSISGLGTMLFIGGLAWAWIMLVLLMSMGKGSLPVLNRNAFAVALSTLVFFPLACAVTVRMLITSMKKKTGETMEEPGDESGI